MQISWRWVGLLLVGALAVGCNNDNGPTVSAPIIAKAGMKNGDAQTGPAGQPLPSPLRAYVTRDDTAASNVTVTWSTGNGGSLTPTSEQTDANGLSSTVWTLGPKTGPQAATARIDGNGVNTSVTFTANATGGTAP
jgi:hypothetical protein